MNKRPTVLVPHLPGRWIRDIDKGLTFQPKVRIKQAEDYGTLKVVCYGNPWDANLPLLYEACSALKDGDYIVRTGDLRALLHAAAFVDRLHGVISFLRYERVGDRYVTDQMRLGASIDAFQATQGEPTA